MGDCGGKRVVRRQTALVFCDLVNSTAILSSVGETANDELRRDIFGALRVTVNATGGNEVKNLGDGLMVSYPDVSSALPGCEAMLEAITRLRPRWPEVVLDLRVGCSAGEATEEDGDWFGTPVVEAARLCSAAAAGEILVAARAIDKPAAARYEPFLASVGALELKGLPAPVESFRFQVDPIPPLAWALPPELDPALAPPLSGREAELKRLADAFARTEDGLVAVTVSGPPGVGKTRLIGEASATFVADGALVVRGALGDVHDPLAPLLDAARWALDGGELVNIAGPDDDVVAGLTGLFGRLALHRPLVLVLDTGAGSAILSAAIGEVLAGLESSRVLAIVEEHADPDTFARKWMANTSAERIALPPLSVTELAALVPAVTDGAAVGALHREAEGLPARALEIGRSLSSASAPITAMAVHHAATASCPYKGLLPYDVEDVDRFFGREGTVAAVLDRLRDRSLVTVVGASGSGKSSLVRAGVVPRFEAERGGRAAVFTPGVTPIAALDRALRKAGTSCAVVVDQFEELFVQCEDIAVRRAFASRITALADSATPVVLTVRGDYFGRIAEFPEIADLVELGTVLVGALAPDDLRRIVEEPARQSGYRLEPGLADRILGDIGGDPSGLPLLSHVLMETWRRRRGRVLTVAGYEAAGGARGAIARTADAVFESLDGPEQAVVRTMLLRLTELGEASEDSRRVVPLDDLVDVEGNGLGRESLDRLIRARLVTVGSDGWVTVAHEALIRCWPRLRGWLETDRKSLQTERHLASTTADWDRLGRPDSELYRGERLVALRDWLERQHPSLTTTQRAFVEASEASAQAATALQRRTTRRLRRLLSAAAVGLVLALVTGGLAMRSSHDAGRQAQMARVQRMAAQAVNVAGESRPRALDLAVEAFHRRPDLVETQSALLNVLAGAPGFVGTLGAPGADGHALVTAPGGLIAMPVGDRINLWDPHRLLMTNSIVVGNGDYHRGSLAFASDGRLLVLRPDGSLERWNTGTRQREAVFHSGLVGATVEAATSSPIARISSQSQTEVVDTTTGAVIAGPVATSPGAWSWGIVGMSSDGTTIVSTVPTATGSELQVLDARTLHPVRASIASPDGLAPNAMTSLAVSRHGDYAAIPTWDPSKPFVVFDLHKGTTTSIPGDHFGTDARFTDIAGTEVLLTTTEVGTAVIDLPAVTVRSHLAVGGSIASENVLAGDLLVQGSPAPTVWSLGGATPLGTSHDIGLVWSLSPDGRYGITTDAVNGLPVSHLYELSTNTVLHSFDGLIDFLDHDQLRFKEMTNVLHVVDFKGVDQHQPLTLGTPEDVTWDAVDPTGRFAAWVVTGDDQPVAHVTDMASGTSFDVRVDSVNAQDARSMPESTVFSPTGGLLAVTAGGTTKIVHLPSGTVVSQIHDGGAYAVFSGDGKRIGVFGAASATVYNSTTGRPLTPPLASTGIIKWASLDQHGGRIALISSDHTQLFDVTSGERVGPAFQTPGGSYAMFTNNELMLPTTAGYTLVPLDQKAWASAACRAAGSNLSDREWRHGVGSDQPYRVTCPGLPRRRS
jgi:class 3 adenylate cyclase